MRETRTERSIIISGLSGYSTHKNTGAKTRTRNPGGLKLISESFPSLESSFCVSSGTESDLKRSISDLQRSVSDYGGQKPDLWRLETDLWRSLSVPLEKQNEAPRDKKQTLGDEIRTSQKSFSGLS
jgi:hypothetical protein